MNLRHIRPTVRSPVASPLHMPVAVLPSGHGGIAEIRMRCLPLFRMISRRRARRTSWFATILLEVQWACRHLLPPGQPTMLESVEDRQLSYRDGRCYQNAYAWTFLDAALEEALLLHENDGILRA